MIETEKPTPPQRLVFPLATVALLACSREESAPPPVVVDDELVEVDDESNSLTPSILTRASELTALGYVDFGDEEDLDAADGLDLHDPELAWPGYTLYINLPTASAYLLDMEGRERASWKIERANMWIRAEILSDGDILVVGENETAPQAEDLHDDAPPPKAGRFVLRMSWEGEVRWRKDCTAHHDIDLTPEGKLLLLGESHLTTTEVNPDCGVVDNSLILMTLDGELLSEFPLYDVLRSDPTILPFVEKHTEETCSRGVPGDCLHLNSFQWIDRPDLVDRHPLYEAGNVLVSSRSQNAIAVVSFERRELIWAWGVGEVSVQHEAKLLENGNILLLDNGTYKRGWSRVIELDPVSEEIVWQYRADPPESFFTAARGTVQALPNGNVLIASSGQGRIFEVTREGRTVWSYSNPHWMEKMNLKRRGALRAKRYAVERIEPLLARDRRR